MIALISLILATVSTAGATVPKTPAEAIILAEAHPDRGTIGVFRMKVAAVERRPNALYLNSSTDYRSSDDVTFNLTPIVAKELEKKLGAKPEIALLGKDVTVKGELKRVLIANMFSGRARSLNRYQHTVFVHDTSQIIVE